MAERGSVPYRVAAWAPGSDQASTSPSRSRESGEAALLEKDPLSPTMGPSASVVTKGSPSMETLDEVRRTPSSPPGKRSLWESEEIQRRWISENMAEVVTGPLAAAARDAVREGFAELVPGLIQSVNEILASRLHEFSEQHIRTSPYWGPVFTSSSPSFVSKPSRSFRRNGTNLSGKSIETVQDGPWRPQSASSGAPPSDKGRDIRTLEADLTNLILEDSGLARRNRHKNSWVGSQAASPSVVQPSSVSVEEHVDTTIVPAVQLVDMDEEEVVKIGTQGLPSEGLVQSVSATSARLLPPTSPAGSAPSSRASSKRPALRSASREPGAAEAVVAKDVVHPFGVIPNAEESVVSNKSPCTENGHRLNVVERSPSSKPSKVVRLTTAEILTVRVGQLTEDLPKIADLESEEDIDPMAELSSWAYTLLKIFGILRCGTFWHRPVALCAVLALSFFACVDVIVELVLVRRGPWTTPEATCDDMMWDCVGRHGQLSNLSLGVGTMAALWALGWRCGKSLRETFVMLEAYAWQHNLRERWYSKSRWDAWRVFGLWLAAIGVDALSLVLDSVAAGRGLGPGNLLHLAAHSVLVSVLLAHTFCLLYVCRALTVAVDLFCCGVVDYPDIDQVFHAWNVLQAVLRKASASIELCFIVLQVVAVLTVPFLMADFFTHGSSWAVLPTLLPGFLVTVSLLQVFLLAAAVTDKCGRVPALVNALSFGHGTERVKQHIVEYIINSAAGFYVFNVRLTTGMALKFIYGWGMLAFGIGTTLFSR